MSYIQVKAIDRKEPKLGLEKYGLTRSPGSGFYIEALADPRTGARATGLTTEEATTLGRQINEDLSPFSPFWDSFRVKLEDKTLVLDLDAPVDYIKYSVLKQSKYVAPTLSGWRAGQFPEALFIIHDQKEEIKVEKTILEKSMKAAADISLMLPTKRKWLATSMFKKSYENMGSAEFDGPFVDLSRYVKESNTNVNTFLDRWMVKSDERLEAEYLVNLGIIYNALRKSGDIIKRGDNELGHNMEAAIDYLTSPMKQETRMQIENEIASKIGITFRTVPEAPAEGEKPTKKSSK